MARLIPNTLFMRLFLVLAITLSLSHVLGIALVSNVRDSLQGPPPPPMDNGFGMQPPAMTPPVSSAADGRSPADRTMPSNIPPQPGGPGPRNDHHRPPWKFILLDFVLRLAGLLLVSWVGARWLSGPIHRLAQAANAFGKNLDAPALEETGTVEIRQAAHAMNEMREKVRRQINERSVFLAAISHDLRTPLTRMQLRAESIEPDSLQHKFREDIAEMASLISAALDYLRGHMDTEAFAVTDITSMVQAMAEDLQDQGHDVQVSGSVAPMRIKPLAIRRCVGNLIQNALKYGQSADIDLQEDESAVMLTIRDQGPGIDPSRMEEVFQPFVRLEGSRNRSTGGVGLGLTIARDIALAHGGELRINNGKPKGLVAVLRLPKVRE